MKNRTLGKSGISVAPLALGGNVFGWTIDEKRSFQILDAFVDRGLNLIDTANMYSAWVPGHQGGESEAIIGNWFKQSGKRKKVVIATKVGMAMGDGSQGLKKDYILKSVEDSLKRLQTDVIDLYQSHQDDAETPLEETLEAYSILLRQGKIRAIGASNYTGARLKQALEVSRSHDLPAYVSLQPKYNLYDRAEFESTLEPLCLKENIGVINYYPLASGFLTGKYRTQADLSQSVRGKSSANYLNERGLRILGGLDKVAADLKTTPAAVSLAWLMQRPAVTAPIASATTVAQLEELMASTQVVLSAEHLRVLDGVSAV